MLKTKLAVALALAFAGAVAFAHPYGAGYGPRGMGHMGGYGPDGDHPCWSTTEGGQAQTRQERRDARFKAMDTDKDGKISLEEYQAAPAGGAYGMGPGLRQRETFEQHREAHFKTLDADKDGVLTKEEVKTHPGLTYNFDTIDTNKDGKVSLEEFQSGHPMGGYGRGRGWRQAAPPKE